MNFPGVNSNFLVNHESTTYIDENGEKITKEHLSVPSKIERENILFWQFMQYHNQYEDIKFPMFWKERDAPNDFTVENHDGEQLKIEVISMGNQTVGDEFDNFARKVQGLRTSIQRRMDIIGLDRGHLILFHAHTPQSAVYDINSSDIYSISAPPTPKQLRAWIKEAVDKRSVIVVRLEGQHGPNIYQYDSGVVGKKQPYGALVQHAIEEKEAKPYDNHADMTLLIDDRTTWYSKAEVLDFFESQIAQQIGRATKFKRICILVSSGGGHLGEHGHCEYFSIKSPKYA